MKAQPEAENDSPSKQKKPKKEKNNAGGGDKKQNSQALAHVVPRNLDEQKELFFESNCEYDPQFEYENYDCTQKFLQNYREPSEDLMEISQKILDSFI